MKKGKSLYMPDVPDIVRYGVNFQPVFRLVDLFEESIGYDRTWCLPFNSLCLCTSENVADPSVKDLPESGKRIVFRENQVLFTTCNTPMRIRYTPANRHCVIHFRYEIFPGVDLFDGIREAYEIDDDMIREKIRLVFCQEDPVKRLVLAENAALEIVLKIWPRQKPLDFQQMMEFLPLFQYVREHLDCRLSVPEMAAVMHWSPVHFSRKFHAVFHMTPKQYLIREILTLAMLMLKDRRKSIKEVANQLRFSTEFNFSRFIKHHTGYAPSELRHNSEML